MALDGDGDGDGFGDAANRKPSQNSGTKSLSATAASRNVINTRDLLPRWVCSTKAPVT